MPVTTAKAWYSNAASNSFLNVLQEFHNFLTNGALTYHTVLGSDFTSPYGEFDSPWLLVRNETAGYRIFLFSGTIGSFNGIFAMLDPTDTIVAPSATTNTPANYAAEYPLASNFVNVVGGYFSADSGTLIHAAEYSDAIFFGLKHATLEYWQYGMHAGKIYVPFNAGDPALGIDGFGILGNTPTVRDSTAQPSTWLGQFNTSTYPNSSRVKIGSGVWRGPNIVTGWPDSDDSTALIAADLNSNVRLIPIAIFAGTATGSTGGLVGYTKYIRLYKDIGGHGAVINASDASDQAWFRFSGENGSSRSVMLWSKTPVNGDL